MPDIRANAVEVVKACLARCKVPGCDWSGELCGSYAEANAERQYHLESHRQEARDAD